MITGLFLMLFTTAIYIEWGLKQDQKEQRTAEAAVVKRNSDYERKAS